MVIAEAFETMVTVIWGGTVYPRTSVHHTVSLSSCIMELACAIGFLKLGAGILLEVDINVVLELDINVALALLGVIVVKAIKEPLEGTELKSTLGGVLRVE